jgi:hypothetical protein
VFPCGRIALLSVGLVSLFLSVPIIVVLVKASTKSGRDGGARTGVEDSVRWEAVSLRS